MAETIPGGLYKQGDKYVNAEGKEVKPPKATQPETKEPAKVPTAAYPYADLLKAKGYGDWASVRAAKDEDLIAIEGIGPARLAEIRAFK